MNQVKDKNYLIYLYSNLDTGIVQMSVSDKRFTETLQYILFETHESWIKPKNRVASARNRIKIKILWIMKFIWKKKNMY